MKESPFSIPSDFVAAYNNIEHTHSFGSELLG